MYKLQTCNSKKIRKIKWRGEPLGLLWVRQCSHIVTSSNTVTSLVSATSSASPFGCRAPLRLSSDLDILVFELKLCGKKVNSPRFDRITSKYIEAGTERGRHDRLGERRRHGGSKRDKTLQRVRSSFVRQIRVPCFATALYFSHFFQPCFMLCYFVYQSSFANSRVSNAIVSPTMSAWLEN